MQIKKLVPALYTASLLLSGFCPMALAVAMQPQQPMERVSQPEEVLMSPYMPMTLVAPMSVAPVVIQHGFSSITQTLDGCSGANCIGTDHTQKQEVAVSVANGQRQGGTALPTIILSVPDSLSTPPQPPLHTGGSHFANTIATIVLRV